MTLELFPRAKSTRKKAHDTSALIDKDLYIEKVIIVQTVRLYLIAGVEEKFTVTGRDQ